MEPGSSGYVRRITRVFVSLPMIGRSWVRIPLPLGIKVENKQNEPGIAPPPKKISKHRTFNTVKLEKDFIVAVPGEIIKVSKLFDMT